MERLSHRVVKSGFWVFALRITDRIFYLIRLVVLARVLSPHDFGLMGIAMLTMLMLENFSQTGFQAALIQKKENIESYLNTAWTTMIIRGIVLFSILFFIAPYAATFFKSPEAKPIIQVIGFSFLIQAFTNIGIIYFQKELEFNKQFIYQLSGTLADFIVAVSAALILRNVWALIFGLLAGNVVRFVVSYFIHPYRPRLSFNFDKVKELSGFGRWVFGSSIIIFFLTQGDNAVVGKLLGATMLGFYQMAYSISNTPATEFSYLIASITFPAYSKVQDDMEKLRRAYLEVLRMSAFVSIPLAGGIFILAPEFTSIFLGEKWLPIVPVMRVLALYGMFSSIVVPGPLFMAINRPDLRTKLQFIGLIIFSICIYPFTIRWGITGAAIAATTYVAITGSFALVVVFKLIKSPLVELLKIILPPSINAIIMVLVIFWAKLFVPDHAYLLQFAFSACLGIAIYSSFALLFDRWFDYGAGAMIKGKFLILFKRVNT
jgi:lipopolysaccharide exporter